MLGGECVLGDDISARAQRPLRAGTGGGRRLSSTNAESPLTLDRRVLQREETRVLSNDWVIRYDTRYLQVARQSHLAPARSTVLVRELGHRRD